ncbi:MAG TPA: TetR/AcrR family transcriptional regulator [Sphingobacteriaceae bacterium]|nr:TetR/AcrR family transcriptional regulator [Sphingobacteriaceae bacterium]
MSKAERTKQFIIEEAASIFNEKGIAGTSIDDILKATKLAKGCLYNHFESKEEFSYASVDYLLGKLTERREITIAKETTARGKIYAFMENHKNPLHSLFDGGCPIVNIGTEADDTSPVIKKKIRNTLETAIKTFTKILQDGIDCGELSAELDPEEYATKMFMAIEGSNATCRVLNSARPMQLVIKSLKRELEKYSLIPN